MRIEDSCGHYRAVQTAVQNGRFWSTLAVWLNCSDDIDYVGCMDIQNLVYSHTLISMVPEEVGTGSYG